MMRESSKKLGSSDGHTDTSAAPLQLSSCCQEGFSQQPPSTKRNDATADKETAVLNSIDPPGPIFKGHHQPLDIWIPYLCFMGLNLSNRRTAAGLGLNKDDVQRMT